MKKCPYCAEKIKDAAIVCRYCGRDLPHIEPNSMKPSSTLIKDAMRIGLIFSIISVSLLTYQYFTDQINIAEFFGRAGFGLPFSFVIFSIVLGLPIAWISKKRDSNLYLTCGGVFLLINILIFAFLLIATIIRYPDFFGINKSQSTPTLSNNSKQQDKSKPTITPKNQYPTYPPQATNTPRARFDCECPLLSWDSLRYNEVGDKPCYSMEFDFAICGNTYSTKGDGYECSVLVRHSAGGQEEIRTSRKNCPFCLDWLPGESFPLGPYTSEIRPGVSLDIDLLVIERDIEWIPAGVWFRRGWILEDFGNVRVCSELP